MCLGHSLGLWPKKPCRVERRFQKLETITIKCTSYVTAFCLACASSKWTLSCSQVPRLTHGSWSTHPITTTTTTTTKKFCRAEWSKVQGLPAGHFEAKNKGQHLNETNIFKVVMYKTLPCYKCHSRTNCSICHHPGIMSVDLHRCPLEAFFIGHTFQVRHFKTGVSLCNYILNTKWQRSIYISQTWAAQAQTHCRHEAEGAMWCHWSQHA